MMKKTIYITDFDFKRLDQIVRGYQQSNPMDSRHIKELNDEMSRAKIVDAKQIPNDVVTMNSTVQFKDMDTNEEATYTLVFPQDADVAQKKISILAPIGTALIGYRVNDTIEWKLPAGIRRLKVIKILYQPEAAGHYHL